MAHLEIAFLGSDQVQEEIIEHGSDAVGHGRMNEHAINLLSHQLQNADRLQTHHIVESTPTVDNNIYVQLQLASSTTGNYN